MRKTTSKKVRSVTAIGLLKVGRRNAQKSFLRKPGRRRKEGQDVSAVGTIREAAHAGGDREGGETAATTGSGSDQRRDGRCDGRLRRREKNPVLAQCNASQVLVANRHAFGLLNAFGHVAQLHCTVWVPRRP